MRVSPWMVMGLGILLATGGWAASGCSWDRAGAAPTNNAVKKSTQRVVCMRIPLGERGMAFKGPCGPLRPLCPFRGALGNGYLDWAGQEPNSFIRPQIRYRITRTIATT